MSMEKTLKGTPQQLADHLRSLAESDRSNATNERLPQKERRWHAGHAAGLDLAAGIVENFVPQEVETR